VNAGVEKKHHFASITVKIKQEAMIHARSVGTFDDELNIFMVLNYPLTHLLVSDKNWI
jgi:hypothetical protein